MAVCVRARTRVFIRLCASVCVRTQSASSCCAPRINLWIWPEEICTLSDKIVDSTQGVRCGSVLLTSCVWQVMDLAGEETPQIYALCGRGPRSTMRTLRHGLAVAEMAVSELPTNPGTSAYVCT